MLATFEVIVVPLSGRAQPAPATSVPRVGFLMPASVSDPRVPPFLQAFRQGLRTLGYEEGRNIALELRGAEGYYDRLPGLAAELVRLKVNVIVAPNSPATQAARQATETIPIVMVGVADPVATGFVASLAHPGGNITGLSGMMPELAGKQLDLLKQVLPKVSRVALLENPEVPGNAPVVRYARSVARTLGVRLQLVDARNAGEIDTAFAAVTTEQAGAVIVLADTVLLDHRARIIDHATRRRLPTVFGLSEFADAGGLLAYGPSLADGYRRAAAYVDKILKGARAADLPVEQPVVFELVINLKAAKTLGVAIPSQMLHRADRVIQ